MDAFKFNTGDKVAIASTNPSLRFLNNLVGEVVRTYRSPRDEIKYGVAIPGHPNMNSENRIWWVTDDELVMVRSSILGHSIIPKAYYDYCKRDVEQTEKLAKLAQNIPCYVPKKVIFSPPKTIVLWEDGTKTIVVCAEGYQFDPYVGFCAAVAKRNFGTNSQIKKVLKNAEYREGKRTSVHTSYSFEGIFPSNVIAEIGEKLKNSRAEMMARLVTTQKTIRNDEEG